MRASVNTNNGKSETLKLNKLSHAVLVAMGAFAAISPSYAGPGSVPACNDNSPVSWSATPPSIPSCTSGNLINIPTNYANSPKLRKFVDPLPGLGVPISGTNFSPTEYIPVTVKDTTSYPGSDYYELAVVEYSQRMHSDLAKPTTLRGYAQIDRAATNGGITTLTGTQTYLRYDGTATPNNDATVITVAKEKGLDATTGKWDHSLVKDVAGNPVMVPAVFVDKPHYLGPAIIATKGGPTRIKMNNLLPKGRATTDATGVVTRNGDMFLPVDETLGGAGKSPVFNNTFPQNRVAIHLHGGDSPWISDGTPHQWFSAETDPNIDPLLKRGDRSFNVPDMPDPGEAAQTLFWPNDQSARLMWYHDHTFGLTRQNAYAGMAAPYLITDPAENAALSGSGVTAMPELPLVIQDKTFVPGDIAKQDALWDLGHWGKPGDLWYPHVYEPLVVQSTNTNGTAGPLIDNPAGRWDYAPTLGGAGTTFSQPLLPLPMGGYGQVSTTPEAYNDTPVVNGVAYPTITVDAKAYRVRFLNGANDRYFNLSLWKAVPSPAGTGPKAVAADTDIAMVDEVLPVSFTVTNGGAGYINPIVTINDLSGNGSGATATAVLGKDSTGASTGIITAINITNQGSGYRNPSFTITDSAIPSPTPAMVTLNTVIRPGQIPDPSSAGPAIIQFGNEAGLLPAPIVHTPKPMGMQYQGPLLGWVETGGGFYLGNAERADTVIDFSQFPGETLILYNDSTAPVPSGDPRYDYYTGSPDNSASGGAPSTLAGYGPNTRTIMQIKVAGIKGSASPNSAYDSVGNGGPLKTVLPGAFAAVADAAPVDRTTVVADGQSTQTKLSTWLAAHGIPQASLDVKTIEAGQDVNFGRLIANFGTEKVITNLKPSPLGYIDQASDIVSDDPTRTYYWHIKNNDVDNHPIHFHLFNVQVLARVDQLSGYVINPNLNEAGWKETVQNWPGQDVIVALKPKTPALPFGLPESVRLKDPTLNSGDTINTSLNYPAGTTSPNAFVQFDTVTGLPSKVSNDVQNYGWEYVFHCHILGHEENDLMRPMIFHPKTVVAPGAPASVTVDETKDKVSWTDATPLGAIGTKGNAANEIGFRVEYAEKINGIVGNFTSATPKTIQSFAKIPDVLNPGLDATGKIKELYKINAIANSGVFETTIAGFKPNTDLVYQVLAVNQGGQSTPVKSADLLRPPAVPSGLAIQNLVPRSLTVVWNDNASNEDGYVVEYRNTAIANAAWVTGTTTLPGVTFANVTNLQPATNYEFRVGATKQNNTVASTFFPVQYSTTTISQATPPDPTPVAGLNAVYTASTKSVTLNWSGLSGNTVQRSMATINQTSGAITWNVASTLSSLLPANTTTYVDKGAGVAINTLYQYRVGSGQVNVITANTIAGVSQLQATGVNTTNSISFQWQQSTSPLVTGYEIMRCTGNKAFCSIATANAWSVLPTTVQGLVNTKFTDNNLATKTSYSYKVRSVNSAVAIPVSGWSSIYSASTL